MRIGEVRVRLLRVMTYASFVTLSASIASMVKLYSLSWWWLVLGVIPLCLLYILDGKIVKGEQAYFNDNNEALQELIRAVNELRSVKC